MSFCDELVGIENLRTRFPALRVAVPPAFWGSVVILSFVKICVTMRFSDFEILFIFAKPFRMGLPILEIFFIFGINPLWKYFPKGFLFLDWFTEIEKNFKIGKGFGKYFSKGLPKMRKIPKLVNPSGNISRRGVYAENGKSFKIGITHSERFKRK